MNEQQPTGDEIHRVCRYIAQLAEALFWGSGEPGLENAGTYVSVCATDPEFADAVVKSGSSAMIDNLGKFDAMLNGCLSYRTKDGRILTPAEARALSGVADQ